MIKSFTALQARLVTRLKADDGATMVEYGLMVALIAVGAIAAVTLLGNEVEAAFNAISAAL